MEQDFQNIVEHVQRAFVNIRRVHFNAPFLFSLATAPLAGALKAPALQQRAAFLQIHQTQQYRANNGENTSDSHGCSGQKGGP